MARLLFVVGLAAIAHASATACASDSGGGAGGGSNGQAECIDLSSVCHGFDDEGPLDECHEIGHAFDGAKCLDVYGGCIAICEAAAAEADASGGAGGSGAVEDGGSTDASAGSAGGGAAGASGPGGEGGAGGSGGTAGTSAIDKCFELSRICHGFGDMGRLDDCHEIGHSGDHDVCEDNWDECYALCTAAADAG